MNAILNISDEDYEHPLPQKDYLQKVVDACFENHISEHLIELGVTNVTTAVITEVNFQYRKKNKATNVLSFIIDEPVDDHHYLGDVLCCGAVIEDEAREAKLDLLAHWTHMIIHSCLHLQGHTHDDDATEATMQAREVALLKHFGIQNPYTG